MSPQNPPGDSSDYGLPAHLRDGVRFECQGTGRCCTSPGAEGYVYLNTGDRQRMAKHLGLELDAFTEQYCSPEEDRHILKDCYNQCRFLDGKSCSVYLARPLQCRTFPFWPAHLDAKYWTTEVVANCPGIGKGRLYEAEEIQALIALTDQ